MRGVKTALLAVSLSSVLFGEAHANGKDYKPGDEVPVIANKIFPFSNPSETYPYYALPYCAPTVVEHQSHNLGEILSGDRKVKTPYDIKFKTDVQWANLCTLEATAEQVEAFQKAVNEEYFFEMHIDGLPIVGYVGDSDKETDIHLSDLSDLESIANPKKYLYTHLHFDLLYNGDNVIALSMTYIHKDDITDAVPRKIEFSYSVKWTETSMTLADRIENDIQIEMLPKSFEIHWISIMNSFVLVVLLVFFLAITLMRVLKNDLTRYMSADDDEEYAMTEEETGWKLVHGDVFRFPKNKMLFSSVLGAGSQLLCMVFLVLVLALLSVFSTRKRGALATASIIMYALSAGVGGYVSGRMYRQMGGDNWVWNTILTSIMFPAPLLAAFMYVNTVAIAFESSAALPFGTIMVVVFIFLLVNFPLTVAGAIVGRNSTGDFEAPCRTTKVPRQIPQSTVFMKLPAQMFVAGFLPFSAIYIEVHYIFASMWGHKIYTLFGILFLAFILLLIVTMFITIALTYFQLAQEDHRWWWRSFLYGASTGMFVFAYCFFYFFERSEMSGLMQTSFFFAYMFVVSYGFCLLLGTVGFFSSLHFVRHIYRAMKAE